MAEKVFANPSHGVRLRTPMARARSRRSKTQQPLMQGQFGRMFSLEPARFGATEAEAAANLRKLGKAMVAEPDKPKDGADEEESGIPALYTYFGQFVDHDITFDPMSSLQKQNDPDALIDFRTPAFDLDCVYGRGPNDQPYMYDNGLTFRLGEPLHGGSDRRARDLQRNTAPRECRRALIGDPRNDENVIVSQWQGLVQRFHNRTHEAHPRLSFEKVQRLVRFHYQYVLLNDFLPRIVHSGVLKSLKSGDKYSRRKLRFFRWKKFPFMPVEFSVAAYRFGHSMVRPGYRINDKNLLPIFPTPPKKKGLTGFRAMKPGWGLDWGRFIDVDVRQFGGSKSADRRRLQFAYRIDTSLVHALATLPASVAGGDVDPLTVRNLLRGWRFGLPSGQRVARQMRVKPLADKDIKIGKAVAGATTRTITSISPVFKGNCPLWTYILAEAMHYQEAVKIPVVSGKAIMTPRLGPVGGRIVAEVFLGLLFADRSSYLNLAPGWRPREGRDYALKNFVRYALGG